MVLNKTKSEKPSWGFTPNSIGKAYSPSGNLHYVLLREKCPNTEFFLVRIFLYSGWIRRDTPYLSVFSRICPYSVQMRENTGQKNFRIWKLFTLLGSEFSLVNLLLLISNSPPLRLCKKNWNFLHYTTNKVFHYWSFFISHLLKKSLMENFIFCTVLLTYLF